MIDIIQYVVNKDLNHTLLLRFKNGRVDKVNLG